MLPPGRKSHLVLGLAILFGLLLELSIGTNSTSNQTDQLEHQIDLIARSPQPFNKSLHAPWSDTDQDHDDLINSFATLFRLMFIIFVIIFFISICCACRRGGACCCCCGPRHRPGMVLRGGATPSAILNIHRSHHRNGPSAGQQPYQQLSQPQQQSYPNSVYCQAGQYAPPYGTVAQYPGTAMGGTVPENPGFLPPPPPYEASMPQQPGYNPDYPNSAPPVYSEKS